MTLDASVTDIGSDTVVGMYQYSLPVVAGTGTISIPFAAGPVCQSQAFNILGLTDNLVDKTKTGHGTTAAPPPSTGASASTTAADEGVIASIATINTESVSYTWQNSFSPGGQALYSPFGGARNYMLLDGLRILSATGTVDAAVSVSAPAILAWCAVVVTYK